MTRPKQADDRIAAITPFGLRMQDALRSQVAAAAVTNGRSMNAEIVARLQASFADLAVDGGVLGQRERALLAAEVADRVIRYLMTAAEDGAPPDPEKRRHLLQRLVAEGFGHLMGDEAPAQDATPVRGRGNSRRGRGVRQSAS